MRLKSGSKKNELCGNSLTKRVGYHSDEYYPTNIIEMYNPKTGRIHPTQKPVELFEYLIKTYSKEGDLVLDNCAGSFTTAVACNNLNRRWICIEKDPDYYKAGVDRVEHN